MNMQPKRTFLIFSLVLSLCWFVASCGLLEDTAELEIVNPYSDSVSIESPEESNMAPNSSKKFDVRRSDQVAIVYTRPINNEPSTSMIYFSSEDGDSFSYTLGDDSVRNNSSGGDNNGGGGDSYDYTWTCPDGSTGSAPIPKGNCESEFEHYSVVFGCNQTDQFRSACFDLYGCLGDDSICDAY